MIPLLITSAFTIIHSHIALAQSPLTENQKHDFCKGVSASQVAIISTLLRDDGSSLSLSQVKISAISEATKIKSISDTTRMGIVAHTNNFEEQHISQMKHELQKTIRQKSISLATYRDLFNKNIPELMTEKYKDCRDEIK